ncbi:hypothetical protein As57867_004174, partial [Aphanomyces stellatus]
ASGKQLAAQVVYALAVFAFVAAMVAAVFLAVRQFGVLRVSEEAERMGLDKFEHGGPATEDDEGHKEIELSYVEMGTIEGIRSKCDHS